MERKRVRNGEREMGWGGEIDRKRERERKRNVGER